MHKDQADFENHLRFIGPGLSRPWPTVIREIGYRFRRRFFPWIRSSICDPLRLINGECFTSIGHSSGIHNRQRLGSTLQGQVLRSTNRKLLWRWGCYIRFTSYVRGYNLH
ncbi:hypothetical protein H4Q26_001643 [Puccinia striiformis f. sp. tritici PST-130]|nr:hypothetical protein H4Q26_001643 [Puccinia striiformis f. sp. tritici PST-130]